MGVFKMYDCDFGFMHNGTRYDFTHVRSMTIEDPEQTNLTRGANAGNKIGLAFTEGLTEPKTITIPVLSLPKAIHDLLKTIYETKARVDLFCISRSGEGSKNARSAVLAQSPKQLTMDETADSMDVSLIWKSFDVDEVHDV